MYKTQGLTKHSTGIIVEVPKSVQNGYKRLYRRARNRGHHRYAQNYRAHSEDLLSLMEMNSNKNIRWHSAEKMLSAVGCEKDTRQSSILAVFAWMMENSQREDFETAGCRPLAAASRGGVRKVSSSAHSRMTRTNRECNTARIHWKSQTLHDKMSRIPRPILGGSIRRSVATAFFAHFHRIRKTWF